MEFHWHARQEGACSVPGAKIPWKESKCRGSLCNSCSQMALPWLTTAPQYAARSPVCPILSLTLNLTYLGSCWLLPPDTCSTPRRPHWQTYYLSLNPHRECSTNTTCWVISFHWVHFPNSSDMTQHVVFVLHSLCGLSDK